MTTTRRRISRQEKLLLGQEAMRRRQSNHEPRPPAFDYEAHLLGYLRRTALGQPVLFSVLWNKIARGSNYGPIVGYGLMASAIKNLRSLGLVRISRSERGYPQVEAVNV